MKPITIIGGGLAGLWLGLRLRHHSVPTMVVEAGDYPRHRVCGEFISGLGANLFQQANLTQIRPSQFYVGRTCAFFGSRAKFIQKLSTPGLHISRYELDAALAAEFQARGGILRLKERWRELNSLGEGLIRATGRRPEKSSTLRRCVGLKAHAKNVALEADLEMHLFPNAYIGLCRLAGETVNICGMFRTENARASFGDWKKLLSGPEGSRLSNRMAQAEFLEETYCSVAGLRVQFRQHQDRTLCLGDSSAMSSPLTGNGMSRAIESAEVALTPVLAFCRGEIEWAKAAAIATKTLRGRFQTRLLWSFALESLLFRPVIGETLLRLGQGFPNLFHLCFARTRA